MGFPDSSVVRNPPAIQETPVQSRVRKIRWRRDRLPTPVFLGFTCGSAGKQSACNARDLGLIPGLGRFSRRREWLPTPVFWPGGFHGLQSMGSKRVGHDGATFTFTSTKKFANEIVGKHSRISHWT